MLFLPRVGCWLPLPLAWLAPRAGNGARQAAGRQWAGEAGSGRGEDREHSSTWLYSADQPGAFTTATSKTHSGREARRERHRARAPRGPARRCVGPRGRRGGACAKDLFAPAQPRIVLSRAAPCQGLTPRRQEQMSIRLHRAASFPRKRLVWFHLQNHGVRISA